MVFHIVAGAIQIFRPDVQGPEQQNPIFGKDSQNKEPKFLIHLKVARF
jgi:hypothetical protein